MTSTSDPIQSYLLTYAGSTWNYQKLVDSLEGLCTVEVFSNEASSPDLSLRDVPRFLYLKNRLQAEVGSNFRTQKWAKLVLEVKLWTILCVQLAGLLSPARARRFHWDMRKVSNIQIAYRAMWDKALAGTGDWFAFFEDDAQAATSIQSMHLKSVIQAAKVGDLELVANVELSDSFSIKELRLEGAQSRLLNLGEAKVIAFPFAVTNTCCASLVKRELVQVLVDSWSDSSRFLPVDLYIAAIAARKGYHSAILLDGLGHGSNFRPKRFA
jgi:hypothetical protein